MRHPTYKHLEARLRLGAFSLGQWAQITTAGAVAAVFGVYLSPFATSVTIFASIVVAGLPVALSYGAMGLEFSVGEFAGAARRYWRAPRRYLPGPGVTAAGYIVQAAAPAETAGATSRELQPTDGELLWDV
jgi:hypothetical protein